MKVMILGDSCSLPRNFPEEARTPYEKTYPTLLRQHFFNAHFFQLSAGGATAETLLGNASGYFEGWDPDFIIVQAGIIDCRPEPIPGFIRVWLTELPSLRHLKSFVYRHPFMDWLIKLKGWSRTSPKRFKNHVLNLKEFFPKSKILWLEIFTTPSGGYEDRRPGVVKRIALFNRILETVLGDSFVPTQKELDRIDGVCSDHIHLTPQGHQMIFELLVARMEAHRQISGPL